jgi:hypothetical protein
MKQTTCTLPKDWYQILPNNGSLKSYHTWMKGQKHAKKLGKSCIQ